LEPVDEERLEAAEGAVALELCDPAAIEAAWSGRGEGQTWETVFPDGCPVRFLPGRAGDHYLAYGERALFHLAPGAGTVLCAPADVDEPSWKRFLLDTGLWSVSLLRGHEALHASAVELPDGVVAFAARMGGGKTSLAAELVRQGHPLFADDVVALRPAEDGLQAHPGPPLMNLPLEQARAGSHAPIGAVLATFDDEAWVAVTRPATEPKPVAALYLLDRRPGVEDEVQRIAPTAIDLLPHSIGFYHQRERVRTRFEVFADLATNVPVLELRANVGTTPAAIAELVLGSVPAPGHQPAALASEEAR
jgi:hypothetical protein